MKCIFKTFLLFFISFNAFSQKDLIEYCNDGITIKTFEKLNISKITITGFRLNKKGIPVVREDKQVYSYNSQTKILSLDFLNMKNKPFKNCSSYYMQDSLGNLYDIDKNEKLYTEPIYEHDKYGRITKIDEENYFYNEKGKLIKKTDTLKYSMGTPVTITEYTYNGDTLKSEITYHTQSDNDNRIGGKQKEYIYENGIFKGYIYSEKYYQNPKPTEIHLFEENGNTVTESIYIDKKINYYIKTQFGE